MWSSSRRGASISASMPMPEPTVSNAGSLRLEFVVDSSPPTSGQILISLGRDAYSSVNPGDVIVRYEGAFSGNWTKIIAYSKTQMYVASISHICLLYNSMYMITEFIFML